jgi:glucan phosphorylase
MSPGTHQCGVLTIPQMPKPFSTPDEFERETVRHIETTLARSLFNCDESAAYSGTALAFRDRLIMDWNKTQQSQTFADQKRVYCEETQCTSREHKADVNRLVPRVPDGSSFGQCHAQR